MKYSHLHCFSWTIWSATIHNALQIVSDEQKSRTSPWWGVFDNIPIFEKAINSKPLLLTECNNRTVQLWASCIGYMSLRTASYNRANIQNKPKNRMSIWSELFKEATSHKDIPTLNKLGIINVITEDDCSCNDIYTMWFLTYEFIWTIS